MTNEIATLDNDCLKDIIPDPIWVVGELDKYIIGQVDAKKALAIAMFQRNIRVLSLRRIVTMDTPFVKNNVLLIGPTGTGKTALVKALSEIMNIPITIFDVSGITSSGYVGGNIEDVLRTHIQNCDRALKNNYQDLSKSITHGAGMASEYTNKLKSTVETGIIYLDEFDKCRGTGEHNTAGRDINGMSVQQELLKVLESGNVNLVTDSRSGPTHGISSVDTSDLLCICGGAFVGLDKIIQARLSKNASIGFMSELKPDEESMNDNIISQVTTEDLILYGYMPEVLGRITTLATLNSLTVESLKAIMTTPKNSVLSQYVNLFEVFGVTLKFEEDALDTIAEYALATETGARALRHIFDKALRNHQFNMFTYKPGDSLVITKKIIEQEMHV